VDAFLAQWSQQAKYTIYGQHWGLSTYQLHKEKPRQCAITFRELFKRVVEKRPKTYLLCNPPGSSAAVWPSDCCTHLVRYLVPGSRHENHE